MTDQIKKEDISQAIEEMRKEEHPDIDDINDDGELEDFADYIEDAAVTLNLGQGKEFGRGCVWIEFVSEEKLQKSVKEIVETLIPKHRNSDTGKLEFVPAKVGQYLITLEKTFALKFQCLEQDILYQLTFEIVYEDGKEVDMHEIKRAYYDLVTKSSNPRENENFSEMYADVS